MRIRREVKIGIFGVAMLVLLFWGINYLKGKDLFVSTNTYYTTFAEVNGLKISTDVMVKGIKVGTITDIKYDPQVSPLVIVEFNTKSEYRIPNDSRVEAFNTLVLGGTVLNVEYGSSPVFYHDHDTIPAIEKPGLLSLATNQFDSIKSKAYELVENINGTLVRVNALLNEENVKNIGSIIAGANRLVSTDLRGAARNLNDVTRTLSENTGKMDSILTNVEAFTEELSNIRLAATMERIDATVTELNTALEKINEGDGTASRLLNDPALYDNLTEASRNLSVLLEDLKAHPKRYVHFSVFGRKDK